MSVSKVISIIAILALSIEVFCSALPTNGLTLESNGIRAEDYLKRECITFRNVLTSDTIHNWDFSTTPLLGKQVTTFYHQQNNHIIANEGNESQKFIIKDDSLQLLRYFQNGLDLSYITPETTKYPIICGSNDCSTFYSEGCLGNQSYVRQAGLSIIRADKVGSLITPDCDTITSSLRIHSRRIGTLIIGKDFNQSFQQTQDSMLLSIDSINHWLAYDSIIHTIDKWSWYAKGYRYPIIEMRKYKILINGITKDSFLQALYFPAETQALELQKDSINEFIREHDNTGYYLPITYPNSREKGKRSNQNNKIFADKTINFQCNATIDNSFLKISVLSDNNIEGICYLYNSIGKLLWSNKIKFQTGNNTVNNKLPSTNAGVYLLIIDTGKHRFCTKVIKKNN